jgi:hypothetical protein
VARDQVTVALLLEGLRQFVSGTHEAAAGVAGVGKATEKSGKQAGIGWKSVAKWAGGAAAIYGAARFVKGAVDQTEQLAKATYGLQKQTGIDAQTGSAWINVLKERGISSDTFRTSLVKLARTMYSAEHGSKSAIQTFKDLGVSQKLVASGDVEKVLEASANGLSKMRDKSMAAADAQGILGRSGVKLIPLLSAGAKGIREQLNTQIKYHNVLSGKSLKDTQKTITQQRQMQAAYAGVKLQLGTALMPVMVAVLGIILKIVNAMEPLLKNSKLLTAVIIALTAAFVAYKIVMIVATIAQLEFDAAIFPIIGIIIGVIAVIAALAFGIYELVKHWGWFKEKLLDVWNWIKKNWPLLLGIITGPIGLAVVLIIKNWKKIKDALLGFADTIKQAFVSLWNWIKGLPGKIGNVATSLMHKIPGYGLATGALNATGLGGVAHALNPFGATGGTVTQGGTIMVGEKGPELVTLPAGSLITPNHLLAGASGFTVSVPVYLDRRQIAHAVGQVTADGLARR